MKGERPIHGARSQRQCGTNWGVSLSDVFGHVGIQESGWLSVCGDSESGISWKGAGCELTSVVTESSRPVSTLLLWCIVEKVEYWGDQTHFLTENFLSSQSAADFGLGCVSGKRRWIRSLLRGGRHRVRWVWGHFFYFLKQEVACSWNWGPGQKFQRCFCSTRLYQHN